MELIPFELLENTLKDEQSTTFKVKKKIFQFLQRNSSQIHQEGMNTKILSFVKNIRILGLV